MWEMELQKESPAKKGGTGSLEDVLGEQRASWFGEKAM